VGGPFIGPRGGKWAVLAFLPGKRNDGFTALHRRDVDKDLKRVRENGVTHVLDLTEGWEPERVGKLSKSYHEAVREAGLELWHEPIVDRSVPEMSRSIEIVRESKRIRDQGGKILVHCMGGLGRTGVITGMMLAAEQPGISGDEIISRLRRARGPRAPDTQDQQSRIQRFAEMQKSQSHSLDAFLTPEQESEIRRFADLMAEAGSLDNLQVENSISKSGPFIGPRGGKWADAQHTIPYGYKGDTGGKGHVKALQDHLEETHGAKVSLSHSGGVTTLHMVKVPESKRGQGVGNAVMHALKRHADKHGHQIALKAEAHGKGGLSTAKLKKWYKAHGFVENKGRKKDYSIFESMYRDPSVKKSDPEIFVLMEDLIKADEGGWETGPRGGTRKKVGGKWVYKKEGSGSGSGRKKEKPMLSMTTSVQLKEDLDENGAHFVSGEGFQEKVGQTTGSFSSWGDKEAIGDALTKVNDQLSELKGDSSDAAKEKRSQLNAFKKQLQTALDDGKKSPYAGMDSTQGKIDDWGRPERDLAGNPTENWGKPPGKGEVIETPAMDHEPGDQVGSWKQLSLMPPGMIIQMAWQGVKTAAKKLEDGSWAGASSGGGGGGGDLTNIIRLLFGMVGFSVRVAALGAAVGAAGVKTLSDANKRRKEGKGEAAGGPSGGGQPKAAGDPKEPGAGPSDGMQKALLYVSLEPLQKSFKPPESVARAAARGLEWRKKAGGKGGLSVSQASAQGIGSGVQRATNLKNRDAISLETVKRMKAFFDRHEKNSKVDPKHKGEPWKDRGATAWLLWGGNAGRAWANKILRSEGELEKALKDTPAKPSERVKGSKRNKPGSAASPGGIDLSDSVVESLKNAVERHNKKSSKKVTLGQLKAVYRRGSGAFSTSHHPKANRHSWSMGRVNSFLERVSKRGGHTQDDDLISS
jgi:protein-tyrosine phosphatase/GNAT superfamily N-acetyltransferase